VWQIAPRDSLKSDSRKREPLSLRAAIDAEHSTSPTCSCGIRDGTRRGAAKRVRILMFVGTVPTVRPNQLAAPLVSAAASLKLELPCKLPSLHDSAPVLSKNLTRCLRNRGRARVTRWQRELYEVGSVRRSESKLPSPLIEKAYRGARSATLALVILGSPMGHLNSSRKKR
jgi:hypothetical protein